MLIALSNLFSNFGEDRLQLQLINVLSQIAFGYVICFLILQLPASMAGRHGALLLLGVQWGLVRDVPWTAGRVLTSRQHRPGHRPRRARLHLQGYYVTINFIGNAVVILFGCWTGLLLRARRPPAFTLQGPGARRPPPPACWASRSQPFNPVIKRLWTASFTFLSAAWVIAMMMALSTG